MVVIVAGHGQFIPGTIPAINCPGDGRVFGRKMASYWLNPSADQLIQALLKWPTLRVSDVRLQSGLQECSITIGLGDFQTASPIPLQASQEYNLCLRLQLLGDQRMDKKAYCPKFPKDRTFGWTIVLGEKKSAKILACHKSVSCGNYGNKLVRLSFKAPSTRGDYAFTIFVFSDTYLGIDQEFDFCCTVELV